MPARLAAPLLLGLALLSGAPARAADGIFGDIVSRPAGAEETGFLSASEGSLRARAARELRRMRWQEVRVEVGRGGASQARPAASVQSTTAR